MFKGIVNAIKEKFNPIKSPIVLEDKPKMGILGAITDIIKPVSNIKPLSVMPTQVPEPTITEPQRQNKRLEYAAKGYTFPNMTNEEKAKLPVKKEVPVIQENTTYKLPTPPEEISNVINQVFGELGSTAQKVAASENGLFKPDRDSPPNSNGSIDRGIFQINSNTFQDYMRRMPNVLNDMGIASFEDMKDPTLNSKMAKLIYENQGWGAWYGPKRVGLNLR